MVFHCRFPGPMLLLIGCWPAHFVVAAPNIIHIVADDLGWTDLSSGLTNLGNGSAFYQTPNIDQLATQGMAFTSAYAMPTCVPTRVALMTGQSGARTQTYSVGSVEGDAADVLLGATVNNDEIPNSTTTLGETLQTAGYTTAHFGKFHVTQSAADITSQHGFDFDYGGWNSGAPGSFFPTQQGADWTYPNPVGPGLDVYADPYTQTYVDENLKPFANGADVDSLVGTAKHLTDATTDAAIDFMSGQLGSGSPFYMNMAFHAVHTPIESRPDLEAKYNQVITGNGGVSPDSRHTDAAYAGLLEGMDQSIGRLIDYLQDPNGDGNLADSIADNTLVVFYGDNGGLSSVTSSDPLQSGKGSNYEGGTRVPLIAWMPGTVTAGSSSDEPVQPVDFYPTFAELGAASLPSPATQPLDGESLAGVLTAAQSDLQRDGVYFHYPGYANSNPGPLSSVVLDAGDSRYKLFYLYEDRSFEVYDLNSDIGEATNLADGDMTVLEYKLAARAISSLRGWLDDTGAVYPTVRADGSAVPAPGHTPTTTFELGQSSGNNLHGLAQADLAKLGVTLSLSAQGSAATFDADATGVGIASSFDSGGAAQNRRIDGTYATAEAIEFSFDEDVYLKSLLVDALNASNAETVLLEFVSGDNPFTSLTGYSAADGFTLGPDFLAFDPATGATQFAIDFGLLSQDEIFLSAGTVLSLTADPVIGGGIALNSISIARPLDALDAILADYDLDGAMDAADLAVWQAAIGSTTALEADGNADGVISGADFLEWQRNFNGGLLVQSAVVAVPEPNARVLLLLAVGIAMGSCRNLQKGSSGYSMLQPIVAKRF